MNFNIALGVIKKIKHKPNKIMLTNKISLDPKITDTGIKENNINGKLILILFIFLRIQNFTEYNV